MVGGALEAREAIPKRELKIVRIQCSYGREPLTLPWVMWANGACRYGGTRVRNITMS